MREVERGSRAERQQGRGARQEGGFPPSCLLPARAQSAGARRRRDHRSAGVQLRAGLPVGERRQRPDASFTGPIARGLSLVSIVVGGVTFAFGEGGSKRLLAGIVFGVGMAIGAVNFMAWLFP